MINTTYFSIDSKITLLGMKLKASPIATSFDWFKGHPRRFNLENAKKLRDCDIKAAFELLKIARKDKTISLAESELIEEFSKALNDLIKVREAHFKSEDDAPEF